MTVALDEGVVEQAKIKAVGKDANLSAMIEKLLMEYIKSTTARKYQDSKND